MSAMMSLAKRRAAMVVGDFDFRNNGAPLTALPAILTALNATYTRNSAKNVVQNGALVSLSANQFGTSYDPVAATYGYVPEPAATNLATNSDGNASTYTVSNASDGTAVPGFTNGIAFGNNSVQRSATKSISVTSGTAYSISIFVIMDDGNAPVVGTTNSTGDFSIALNATIATTKLERLIGSNVYRVSASITAGATSSQAAGIIKYTGQSARTFRITGIQVETGLRATSYIATTGSTANRSADVLTVPLWINNIKDSQDGSTANWSKTNCTCVTSGTAPDGTNTAQLITVTATAAANFYNATCKAPSAAVTASVYVKAGNKTTAKVLLRNDTTATNFDGGVLTYATGAISGSGWSATDVGGGWFRCTYARSSGITVGDTLRIFVHHDSSAGPVAGDTAYFWGAQIEPGSTATAYRPTTSTLESAANANITGFSSAGYTLYADVRPDVALSSTITAIELHRWVSSDRSLLANGAGTTPSIQCSYGGVTQAAISASVFNQLQVKFAGSYQINSIKASARGVALTEDTSVTLPTDLITLSIGFGYSGIQQLNGFLFRAQLIPQALTQAQINGLTT